MPPLYTQSVGDIRVTVLSDGTTPLTLDAITSMFKMPPTEFLSAFEALLPYNNDYKPLYIQTPDATLLIDTGLGLAQQPQFGNIFAALQAEGVALDSINKVVISHFHGDHFGGLLDASGTPLFPNSRIAAPRTEWAYWLESDQAPPERVTRIKRVFDAYAGQLDFYDAGDVLASGIRAVALPGHTPGQSGFMIESNGERLFALMDAIHFVVQFGYPALHLVFDSLPDLAAETRQRALEQAAETGVAIFAYHLPYPGIGHVAQAGTGYVWQPA